MEVSMKGTGRITKLMDLDNMFTLMVMFTLAFGLMIKHTVKDSTSIQTELITMVNGSKTNNMVTVSKDGQMDLTIKDYTLMAKSMAKAYLPGLMEAVMKVNLSPIV